MNNNHKKQRRIVSEAVPNKASDRTWLNRANDLKMFIEIWATTRKAFVGGEGDSWRKKNKTKTQPFYRHSHYMVFLNSVIRAIFLQIWFFLSIHLFHRIANIKSLFHFKLMLRFSKDQQVVATLFACGKYFCRENDCILARNMKWYHLFCKILGFNT